MGAKDENHIKHYSKVNLMMEKLKKTWRLVALLSWMTGSILDIDYSLISFVTCSADPCFLRVVDCSRKKKNKTSNVFQIVTNSWVAIYKLAWNMIQQYYKYIFETPCCLKEIGKIKWFKKVVLDAWDVQMFSLFTTTTPIWLSSGAQTLFYFHNRKKREQVEKYICI